MEDKEGADRPIRNADEIIQDFQNEVNGLIGKFDAKLAVVNSASPIQAEDVLALIKTFDAMRIAISDFRSYNGIFREAWPNKYLEFTNAYDTATDHFSKLITQLFNFYNNKIGNREDSGISTDNVSLQTIFENIPLNNLLDGNPDNVQIKKLITAALIESTLDKYIKSLSAKDVDAETLSIIQADLDTQFNEDIFELVNSPKKFIANIFSHAHDSLQDKMTALEAALTAAPSKINRNILHFKATLEFLNSGEKRKEVDKAIANLQKVYEAYERERARGHNADDAVDYTVDNPKGLTLKEQLKETSDLVESLANDCKNLLKEEDNPSKGKIRKVLTGIMNIFKATGDATMYLQGEKMLAELRLAKPDRHWFKKLGDYFLKGLIQLTQYLLNFTVHVRALIDNTKLKDETEGYRKVFFRKKQKPGPN